MLNCKHCGEPLTISPIWDHSEWIIICLSCRAENVVRPTIEIIGYRAATAG